MCGGGASGYESGKQTGDMNHLDRSVTNKWLMEVSGLLQFVSSCSTTSGEAVESCQHRGKLSNIIHIAAGVGEGEAILVETGRRGREEVYYSYPCPTSVDYC